MIEQVLMPGTEEFDFEIIQESENLFSFEILMVNGPVVIPGTSLTAQTLGDTIAAATEITEPGDTATMAISDPDDIINPDIAKRFTWANLKIVLTTFFAGLFSDINHTHSYLHDAALQFGKQERAEVYGLASKTTPVDNDVFLIEDSASTPQTYLKKKFLWKNLVLKLDTIYEKATNRNQANGYCPLDGGGKVPAANLPSNIMTLEGEWNATTNTPELLNGTLVYDTGACFECTTAGTVDFGAGNITFKVGDWAVYANGVWYKSINSYEVTSVNSKTGTVVLHPDDLSDATTTNKFTNTTEKGTWNGKAEGNHNHSGVYIPVGVIWNSSITVSRTSDTVIEFTAATNAAATLMANSIGGLIAKWTSSDGNTIKRGFVRNATANTTTVTINLQGDAFTAGDINFMLALAERIKKHQVFIPGELTADAATDIGFELMTMTGEDIRALSSSAFVKVAAAGAGADLQYDWFDDGTGLITTDPTFTTNTSVLNSAINNQVVVGGSRLSLRITLSAGATNKASGLNATLYYCNDDLFDAV